MSKLLTGHWPRPLPFSLRSCCVSVEPYGQRALRPVRYVPSNAEALQKTARHGDLAWLIFPIFYFIGVAIMFEILLAFTVEAYIELREESEKEEEEEMEREGSELGSHHGEHEKKAEQLDIDTFFEEAR